MQTVYVLYSFLAVIFLLIASLLIHRKWRQARNARKLIITSPHGIVENRFVPIGGIDQWVSIRGEDRANPVLLIVAGGPGSSYEMFAPIMRAWESHFTVVHWDQRGAGRTFRRNGETGLTFDHLIRDGVEVASYVCSRLGKEKVVLVGSSFGSLIALGMAQSRPELFSAYVGTDQNVAMGGDTSEEFEATLRRLRSLGKKKAVAALEKMGPDSSRWSAKDWVENAKLTMLSDPATNPMKTLLGPSTWFAPEMSLRDMKASMAGMHYSMVQLHREFSRLDARVFGTHYEMPFFVFQGDGDVLTPPSKAAEFFAGIEAPVKEMVLIRNAGHFAAFTQPQQFLDLLVEVLPADRRESFGVGENSRTVWPVAHTE